MKQGLVYIVSCGDCQSQTRIEVLLQTAVIHPGRLFCPCCGSERATRQYKTMDDDTEYFYGLARTLGLQQTIDGANAAKQIYDAWDHEEYHKFMDFFDALKAGTLK